MSEKEVLEAAGVGHRITHDDLPDPRTLVAKLMQSLVVRPRRGGALASQLGRSLLSQVVAELGGDDPGDSPDPCGEIEKGSPNTFLGKEKRPAAILDDELEIPCEDCWDGPLKTGAANVFVNRMPLARRSDELECGALVGEGEPNILIGAARTKKTERRGESMARANPRGPMVGRELHRLDGSAGPRHSRALGGGRDRDRRRRRSLLENGGGSSGAHIGGELSRGAIGAIIGWLTR